MSNNGRFKRTIIPNDHFFDVIGDRQAWLLGLLASDGNVQKQKYITLSQSHDKGRELLLEVAKMLDVSGGLTYQPKVDNHSLYFCSPLIGEQIAKFGIVDRKTLVYTFPSLLSPEHHASFLRGWVDGDGSVGIYRQQRKTMECVYLLISFVGTPEFIETCQLVSPVKGKINRIKHARNLAEFRVCGRKAIEFGRWIWQSQSLPHYYKLDIFEEFCATHLEDRKYNLRLSKQDELFYLLDNGVPVMDAARKLKIGWRLAYKWRSIRAKNVAEEA